MSNGNSVDSGKGRGFGIRRGIFRISDGAVFSAEEGVVIFGV